MYVSNIKSKKEFLLCFNKFLEKLTDKQQKTRAEEILLESFIDVKIDYKLL